MAIVSVVLLAVAVAGAVTRPFAVPAWLAPVACALLAILAGASSIGHARSALHPLVEPIAFLLAAVPLAIGLDRLGFFAELADRLIATGRGSGSLWMLGALVTTVLNLDASVVLLTPLYIQIARSTRRDAATLAFQPVLLACLASSALPVSNLTNLIAASSSGATTTDFVTHLALPSLVATSVGWWCYRRALSPDSIAVQAAVADEPRHPVRHPRALPIGAGVMVFVAVGFVLGPSIGVAAWVVAAAADAALLMALRRSLLGSIPLGTALIAASLGILAAAAGSHLPIDRVIDGSSTASLAGTIAAAAVGANLINNLPALLLALPSAGSAPGSALWATLIGVNMGPVLLVTGSLASLLWMESVQRLGVRVSPLRFFRVGVRVGLPAAVSGALTFLALQAL